MLGCHTGGHSDTMAGVVCVDRKDLKDRLYFVANARRAARIIDR